MDCLRWQIIRLEIFAKEDQVSHQHQRGSINIYQMKFLYFWKSTTNMKNEFCSNLQGKIYGCIRCNEWIFNVMDIWTLMRNAPPVFIVIVALAVLKVWSFYWTFIEGLRYSFRRSIRSKLFSREKFSKTILFLINFFVFSYFFKKYIIII